MTTSKPRFVFEVLQRKSKKIINIFSDMLTYVLLSAFFLAGLTFVSAGLVLIIGQRFELLNPLYVSALVLLSIVLFEPLRKNLQSVVDRVLLKQNPAFQEMEEVFIRELSRIESFDELVSLLYGFLNESINSECFYLFLLDSSTDRYGVIRNPDGDNWSDLQFPSGSSLATALLSRRRACTVHQLHGLTQGELARLSLLGAKLLLPLWGHEQLIGWFALGGKKDNQAYTPYELTFLNHIAEQSGKALERALVVRDLEKNVREMQVLTRVAQGVNFTVALDDMLELVYAQTSQVIPVDDFYILLHDESQDSYSFAFFQLDGERIPEGENKPIIIENYAEQEVIRSQSPVAVADYTEYCHSQGKIPISKGIHSWMGVPLNAGARVIGVISAGSRDPGVFYTLEHRKLLQAFADQVAGAIVKSRLLTETEKRAHQLAALNEISLSLTSTLQVEKLLEEILTRATDLLMCTAGSLFLVDANTAELTFEVVTGPASERLIGKRLPAGTGVAGKVVQTGDPVIINDVSKHEHWFAQTDEETGFKTENVLAVPMRYQNKVIGVIEVLNKVDGSHFTISDRDLLIALSAQASVAIENARLYTLTDQALAARVEELSVMQRIDRELNTSLDIQHAMSITLEWALRQSGADLGFIASVDEGVFNVVAVEGLSPGTVQPLLSNEDEIPALVNLRQAVQRAQVQVNTKKGDGQNEKGFLGESSQVQAVVPIQREQDIIGVLLLESEGLKLAQDEIVAFLTRLSDHSAIAIANARLYAQVREANLAKSKFVSFVAHELKNPMASIKGYTELMAGGMAGQINEMQTSFLETIRSNVDRMNTIVSDLNDLTKIQVGNLRLEFERVSLKDTIDEVVRSLQSQIDAKHQELLINVPQALPPAWADSSRLVQILTNLVSNAHKYTPDGGKIRINAQERVAESTGPTGMKFIHVSVQDTGIGIPPEDQENIFQQYFRTDQAKEMATGTGLGLNITKSLVELQGGQIWFESEPGGGTTFHFTIPVAEIQD